jgi:hypothetical protein
MATRSRGLYRPCYDNEWIYVLEFIGNLNLSSLKPTHEPGTYSKHYRSYV